MKKHIRISILCGLILLNYAGLSQEDSIDSTRESHCSGCTPGGIVDPIKRTSVAVYPNPSSGPFKFQSNVGEIESIQLFSSSGQLLFVSGSFNKRDASIDLSSLESQTLFARVVVNGTVIQKTLIKQ